MVINVELAQVHKTYWVELQDERNLTVTVSYDDMSGYTDYEMYCPDTEEYIDNTDPIYQEVINHIENQK